LIHRASFRIFIRTPTQQFGSVPEAMSGEMIVPYLDDQIRLQRLPLAGALGAPAARTAGRIGGETWRFDSPLEFCEQRLGDTATFRLTAFKLDSR